MSLITGISFLSDDYWRTPKKRAMLTRKVATTIQLDEEDIVTTTRYNGKEEYYTDEDVTWVPLVQMRQFIDLCLEAIG